MLEKLETRRLLDAVLANNTLTITGSSAGDEIELELVNSRVIVLIEPEQFRQSFLLRDIRRISIDAGGGDDLVLLDVAITRRATIMGGDGDDTLLGGQASDVLDGGPGNDLLNGGLDPGLAGDIFIGGEGVDMVDYRTRVAPLKIDFDGNSDDGAAGEGDNVQPSIEVILGGGGADIISSNLPTGVTLYGNAGDDTLSTSGGNDRLVAGPGDDLLNSRGGDDTLIGGHGADTFNGGDGVDTVSYYYTDRPVNINLDGAANDGFVRENDLIMANVENLTGGNGNDTITGSDGDNVLEGLGGNDNIDARGGNDTIDGGAGSDTTVGGDGVDVMTYRSRLEDLNLSIDGLANDGAPGENDNIGPDFEIVEGGFGNDMIIGSILAETLRGLGGNDSIFGGDGNDLLEGNEDDDLLDGEAGADTLAGGAGRDTADFSARVADLVITTDDVAGDGEAGEFDNVMADIERILGGSGNDLLDGGADSETLVGNAGNDTLIGGHGNDSLDGGEGDDLLDPGIRSDTISGGAGIDTVDYSSRTGSLSITLDGMANDGDDDEDDSGLTGVNKQDNVLDDVEIILGGQANDTITGTDGPQTIIGNGGFDSINGGDGDDSLDGGEGDDSIDGGGDDDIIVGGPGEDVLDGGDGDDTIEAADGEADTIDGGAGTDTANTDALLDEVENVP